MTTLLSGLEVNSQIQALAGRCDTWSELLKCSAAYPAMRLTMVMMVIMIALVYKFVLNKKILQTLYQSKTGRSVLSDIS